MDVAQFLKGAGDRRPTKTVYLSPDPDRLSAAQVAARARSGGTLADAPEEVEQARRAALESAWKFTVSTIPASHWEWLLAQHPATPAQRDAAKANGQSLTYNVETFPQAAAAACLRSAVNPDGDELTFGLPSWSAEQRLQTDPQAVELVAMTWETFPLGDTRLLWAAVLDLNGNLGPSAQVQSFANGSGTTRSGAL